MTETEDVHVGGIELIQDILDGKVQPTKVIATPGMVPVITPKLGRFLGVKGLMPSAKRGTVREDLDVAVQDVKGQFIWAEKNGVVATAIARAGFTQEEVESNMKQVVEAVKEQWAHTQADSTKPLKGELLCLHAI